MVCDTVLYKSNAVLTIRYQLSQADSLSNFRVYKSKLILSKTWEKKTHQNVVQIGKLSHGLNRFILIKSVLFSIIMWLIFCCCFIDYHCRLLLFFSSLLLHRQHQDHTRNYSTQVSIQPVTIHWHLHIMAVPIHHFIHHQFIVFRPSTVHIVRWAILPSSNLIIDKSNRYRKPQ